ncbi:MAG: two-component system response regulator [Idiomarinaceae bacterium]|uniref:Two-component system response regulator n=1 Tax=Pseudidiomarina aquimaris TaxID=641841 RepID=A0A432XJG9_9GAMM|nr:response regulator [Pseudidiomarina aquimaris]MBG22619.1 two-component system response regulator [Idiomarinaceae bacterium]RUO48737.1 two-component system response regulator [Pseudidiomarina aquimaris]|tara:strand:- start:1018 stop:1401 length:384 start_codon:yes stop_codon:yes gene_type:complete
MAAAETHVVIVDDDLISLEVMKAMLSHFPDTQISTAQSGQAALELIVEKRPDLVLLDHELPDFNGVELYCKVHDALGEQTPTTAMISGHDPSEYSAECKAAGINTLLQKPLAPSDLTELMRIAGTGK